MSAYDAEIKEVIDNFDFEIVHRVMTFLNWKWAPRGTVEPLREDLHYIPTINDLRNGLAQLIHRAVEQINPEGKSSLATGGFHVDLTLEDGHLFIDASFQVTTYDNC
jgi:hypothetical protein